MSPHFASKERLITRRIARPVEPFFPSLIFYLLPLLIPPLVRLAVDYLIYHHLPPSSSYPPYFAREACPPLNNPISIPPDSQGRDALPSHTLYPHSHVGEGRAPCSLLKRD